MAELTDPGRIRLPGKQRHTRRFLFIISNYEIADEFVRLGSKGLSPLYNISLYNRIFKNQLLSYNRGCLYTQPSAIMRNWSLNIAATAKNAIAIVKK